ncbi:MAG: class I SAM-dependent methyltransferase [Anaerolineae bacterium]|nr:class I SAM-dependent methyltransferase [Anaerolineae bacterium]
MIEVGCGTGNVIKSLQPVCERGHLIGLDLHYRGLALASRRVSCDLILGDINAPPFTSGLSIVGLFDVIEHLPDDGAILKSVQESLTDRGWMIISVPALPGLWSYFDVAAHHVRRYTRQDLARVITEAGFEVKYISFFMMAILPFIWMERKLSKGGVDAPAPETELDQRVSQELRIMPVINEVFSAFLWLEAQLIQARIRLPIGSSLIAIARKRAG